MLFYTLLLLWRSERGIVVEILSATLF